MKKQITKLTRRMVYLSLLVVSFTSCDDLAIDTKGELAAEGFYSSAADIESGTLGVYSSLTDKYFSNSEAQCHLWAADDRTAITGFNKGPFLEYDQMQPLATNEWQNRGWTGVWTMVGAANTFLDNEDQMRGIVSGAQVEALERSLGEVRFLRAFAYFEIVRTWGEVPLISSTLGVRGEESLASFEDIYALIIEDLIFAKNNLGPASVNGVYRATSWMAQSLLANVYLTTAGFPLKNTANYALAATEAKNVIDNGPYAIEMDFSKIYGSSDNNLGVNGNTEAIIAFPAHPGLDGWNAGNFEAETIGFDDKWVEFTFYNNFPAGTRKDVTFEFRDGNARPYYGTSASPLKFSPEDFSANKDIKYMRYAELLLIYAEAQVRATGNESDMSAIDALNEVKVRAGVPTVSSATWEDIVWEKAWETAGEFSRWFDIIRTETLDEVNASRDAADNALTPLGSTLTEANPWAPIPANDVSANPKLAK